MDPSSSRAAPLPQPPTLNGLPPDLADYLIPLGNTTPSSLSGTQDLITLFSLTPLYNTFLRPYLPDSVLSSDEGKGKETVALAPPPPPPVKSGMSITLGGVRIGEVSDHLSHTKAKKAKMEKTYSHLVADIPGRNTIKKDHHLSHLILNPEPQPANVILFDDQTLREAFSLKPGQIPGFDAMIWENDEGSGGVGRKKKKKRKHGEGHDHGVGAGGAANGSGGGGEDDQRKKKKRKGDGGSP